MNIKQSGIVLLRGITMLFIFSLLLCYYTIANAKPGSYDPITDILIDDFHGATGSNPYSHGRTWYSFGGLNVEASNNALHVTGNSPKWSGVGIESNDTIINAQGRKSLCVEFTGTIPIVELYDNTNKVSDQKLIPIKKWWSSFAIPDTARTINLSKIQFKFGPGHINTTINKIYFTNQIIPKQR